MEEKIFEVEHLRKYYIASNRLFCMNKILNRAVDDVSFSINKGSTVGLVGESGCGKSTVGKTILNLIKPTGGKTVFKDKIIFDVENNVYISNSDMLILRKEIQMIFQDPSSCLNPRKTVEQIISQGINKHKICDKKHEREYCEEILNKCGLDKMHMMRYPHEFSGGQRQRIGIARALAVNPSFVVCDEPTAALDVSIQSQILNLMLDMKEQLGLTYLFISHNLGIVEHFCDDVVIMYLGNIVEYGKCKKIYENPTHPYTKLLLDSIPINHPNEVKKRISNKIINAIEDKFIGCKFYSRCPYAEDICYEIHPKLKAIDASHMVACHKR